MKKYFLLIFLLMQIFSGTVALAMEVENRPWFDVPPIHLPSALAKWEAGKNQGYPTLSDFLDTEKNYLISPKFVEEACAREGKIFYKNHKAFELSAMTPSCDLLKNYQPMETLLRCHPLSEKYPGLQGLGWYCADWINDGEDLNNNDIFIYFEIRKVEISNTKTRPRQDEIFPEIEQGENKKFRKESNEMDVI